MEAPKIDHEAIAKSVEGKLCPVLSLASLSRPEARIALAGEEPQKPVATNCQGEGCAWFKLMANEKGEVVSGECAVSFMVTALTVGQQSLAQGQLALMGAFVQAATPPKPGNSIRHR